MYGYSKISKEIMQNQHFHTLITPVGAEICQREEGKIFYEMRLS
jgi:hypothetical protein